MRFLRRISELSNFFIDEATRCVASPPRATFFISNPSSSRTFCSISSYPSTAFRTKDRNKPNCDHPSFSSHATFLNFVSNAHRVFYLINRRLESFQRTQTSLSCPLASSYRSSFLPIKNGFAQSQRQFHSSTPTWRKSYKGTYYKQKAPVAEVLPSGLRLCHRTTNYDLSVGFLA